MKVLFFGDVYGKAGRHALLTELSGLKEKFKPDFLIVNAENLADGKGVTEKTLDPLFSHGIDAVTGGNHLWDRYDSIEYIKHEPRIVKSLNYPETIPGNPFYRINKNGKTLGVLSLSGQTYMPSCDNPFIALSKHLQSIREPVPTILDFHAESTSEKRAMGWFADGKICACLGTHTHIQTADEEILPLGCAYITDVGMTGSHDSVIGVKKEIIVGKFLSSIPMRYEASDLGVQINAVLVEIDDDSSIALNITRIKYAV